MQKKDLQSHMIKLHGAPKPHAVSARLCRGLGGHTLMLAWSRCRKPGGAGEAPRVAPPGLALGLLPPSGPSGLQCPTCAKCFLSRTELQLHEAFKHRGEKLFVCEECGHRASSRNGLQMHIKAKHRWGKAVC